MKTVLTSPSSWSLPSWTDDGFTLLVDDGLTVEVSPPRHCSRAAASPPGGSGTVHVARSSRLTTASGWPFELVEAAVVDGGEVVEARLIARYQFLDHVATAVVRSRRQELLGKHRPAVLEALRSARPDWAGSRVSALCDLWSADQVD